jgi:hypothetical protein
MSWGKSFTSRQAFQSAAERQAGREAAIAVNGLDTGEAFDAAMAAAALIIDSGAVGDTSKDFTVSLSGHSNPKHNPGPGGVSKDFISININQK